MSKNVFNSKKKEMDTKDIQWKPMSDARNLAFMNQYLLRIPRANYMFSGPQQYFYEVCTYVTDFIIRNKYMNTYREKAEWTKLP